MVEVTLPYGESSLRAELPDLARVVGQDGGQTELLPAPDQAAAVRQALEQPLGLPNVRELVRPSSRVLIAFDDPVIQSPGPVRQLAIEFILAELAEAGVPEENVHLVCANALHRKWTDKELATLIGEELVRRFGPRLTCHDAEDAENLTYFGTTEHGYDVEVHRLVADSDLTIYVNAACRLGFSGGWKSVMVGLSTWRSIRWTHTPDGMSQSVRENRMHVVLDEMGQHLESKLAQPIFKVETLLANPATIGRVWAGGVRDTRAEVLEVQAGLHPPRRSQAPEKADIVVYGVPDWSGYAAFASLNPILTLISTGLGYMGGYIQAAGKPGCSVIMATPCAEEWDMEHHPAYKEVWDRVLPETRDPYEISERFMDDFATRKEYIEKYRFGYAYHPVHAILAVHPLKRLRHAGRVFVAGPEDAAVPRHVGFTPTATIEEAIAQAQRIHGRDCSITCIASFPGM